MTAMIACRVTVTSELLEDGDFWFSHELRRFVMGHLWGVPVGVRVFLDLGPIKHLDPNLAREIGELPCAPMIVFESSNWEVAKAFADAVNAAVLARRVTAE